MQWKLPVISWVFKHGFGTHIDVSIRAIKSLLVHKKTGVLGSSVTVINQVLAVPNLTSVLVNKLYAGIRTIWTIN